MNTKVCKKCGEIFVPKTAKQEFCNNECRYNYYNVHYNCDNCGEDFLTKRTMIERLKQGKRKHLYCPDCTNNGQGSTNVINICVVCGTEFPVAKAFSNQKYCSRECTSMGMTKYKDVECPVCKTMFHPKSENTIFCSNECKFEYYRDRVKCTCDYCGKEIEKVKNEYEKSNRHYCDQICHYLHIAWSEHDIKILRENYGKIPIKDILSLLENEYNEKALRSEAGRLGLYNDKNYWTDSETQILLDNYSIIPMKQMLELLPNRTHSAILGKAKQYNLSSFHCTNSHYSDEENLFLKSNYLEMDNMQLAERLNRTESGISQHLWVLGLIRPKEKQNYETLAKYVRAKLFVWKNKVKEAYQWTCCVTGKRSDIILHHCRSFNLLLSETIDDLNFKIKDNLNDYTQQELDDFVEYFLYLQEYYGEYCCITEEVHKLFHSLYGYGNNTMEQWTEFVADYKNKKYELIA